MYNFTPVTSLIGGILIGLSASAMLLLDGKIAGISGILAGVIRPVKGEVAWKASFTAGLLAGGLLLRLILPGAFAFGVTRSWPVLMMAGLMVGFGARLGNGCTSGHGVCGVSRLSARSHCNFEHCYHRQGRIASEQILLKHQLHIAHDALVDSG